ncbi:hypothetical protein NE237_016220 [Protea cynaroides]|uniref:SAC domain-containing protein n=1 Tax=Protea cynaroides TaxID=273540 RepID=A0A9Q0KFU5_9MAGN|nr:hypothetical protein NE237_016220 [Protea cynaroides]
MENRDPSEAFAMRTDGVVGVPDKFVIMSLILPIKPSPSVVLMATLTPKLVIHVLEVLLKFLKFMGRSEQYNYPQKSVEAYLMTVANCGINSGLTLALFGTKICWKSLLSCKLDPFIIPLIQGNILSLSLHMLSPLYYLNLSLSWSRCTQCLGTRMWSRGANPEGDTANFIETEQLLELDGFKSSFLLVQGSIPLIWEQIVDLSYKPQLKIINHEDSSKVVEHQFHDLTQRYGEVMVVDITDEHGDESKINTAFTAEVQKLSHVRYVLLTFITIRAIQTLIIYSFSMIKSLRTLKSKDTSSLT